MKVKQVAVFASGNGSNAENIIKYFKANPQISIALIASNNPLAKVLKRAQQHRVSTLLFNTEELQNGCVLKELKQKRIDFIVLAGFLLKIPQSIINQFVKKIINIHPSLLPLYGGKGMYGIRVHQKVFEAQEKETGITIHFVNESYDDGAVIFQAKCPLYKNIKLKAIQKKVHELELKFLPRIIENLLNG